MSVQKNCKCVWSCVFQKKIYTTIWGRLRLLGLTLIYNKVKFCNVWILIFGRYIKNVFFNFIAIKVPMKSGNEICVYLLNFFKYSERFLWRIYLNLKQCCGHHPSISIRTEERLVNDSTQLCYPNQRLLPLSFLQVVDGISINSNCNIRTKPTKQNKKIIDFADDFIYLKW